MGSFIQLKAKDGFEFAAYVAKPEGKPRGAIVVLQEIFGVNSHIRSVADGYAKDGYLAVAPATFARAKPDVELGYTPDEQKAGSALKAQVEALPAPGVMQDIQAAVDFGAKESGGKVGVVGYCYGGLLAWRSAAQVSGLAAAVPYYGGGSTVEPALSLTPKVPVLAHFGSQDTHITMDTVDAFRKKHPEVDSQVYDAHHGFNCDQRASFNAEAAKAAREKTLAFFAKHVG